MSIEVKNQIFEKIAEVYKLDKHNFNKKPFIISHQDVKNIAGKYFSHIDNNSKEIRILGSQTERNLRPKYFIDRNLFLLPKSNKSWYFLKGEGYVDIPDLKTPILKASYPVTSKLELFKFGNSEMKFLDACHTDKVLESFLQETDLVLCKRGRFRSGGFNMMVNKLSVSIDKGVQMEVDAGYENKNSIFLIEAKSNTKVDNEIIRQIYFPYREITIQTRKSKKNVRNIFISQDKKNSCLNFYEYIFKDPMNYESIELIKSSRYEYNL